MRARILQPLPARVREKLFGSKHAGDHRFAEMVYRYRRQEVGAHRQRINQHLYLRFNQRLRSQPVGVSYPAEKVLVHNVYPERDTPLLLPPERLLVQFGNFLKPRRVVRLFQLSQVLRHFFGISG